MTEKDLTKFVANALSNESTENLEKNLAHDCVYRSEYARIEVKGAWNIISRMNYVSNSTKKEEYTCTIVDKADILKDKDSTPLCRIEGTHCCKDVIVMYHLDKNKPAAVVSVHVDNTTGKIKYIYLCRNSDIYRVDFSLIPGKEEDFKEITDISATLRDLPSTVKPYTPDDRFRDEAKSYYRAQALSEDDGKEERTCFIWIKADECIKQWFKEQGYDLYESEIFDDSIGYHCIKDDTVFSIYMFAYGLLKTSQLDGDYCSKFNDYPFSKGTTILIVYLNVKKEKVEDKWLYRAGCYYDTQISPILWRLTSLRGRWILEYYPGKKMFDLLHKLMYAFNNDSLDVYDLIVDNKTSFRSPSTPGVYFDSGFYNSLQKLHEEHGDLKLGYIRFNDVVYSKAPYLKNYGYMRFTADNSHDKIASLELITFDNKDNPYREFVDSVDTEEDYTLQSIPQIVSAEALPTNYFERFSLKVVFDNGETKKYVLPVRNTKDEVIKYDRHVFTDKIWQRMVLSESKEPEYSGYEKRGACVSFINGYSISRPLLYWEGEDYSEPEMCNDLFYCCSSFRLTRIWQWKVKSLYEDSEKERVIKVLERGDAFNGNSVSTFVNKEGKRLTTIDFDYIDGFSQDGFALVGKKGFGLGYVDSSFNFITPIMFDSAEEFINNHAVARKGKKWFLIGSNGRKTELRPSGKTYQEVGNFSEGMVRVSTLKLRCLDLAYHSDYEDIAGIWGYVNEKGEEVIKPQYIYANDFENSMAFVCKGEWKIDEKYNNSCATGRYWTDTALWGAINEKGEEVIPLIFDEIERFNGSDSVFRAHYGGWEDGRWGVIDTRGAWVVEPAFNYIGWDFFNGCFSFSYEDDYDDTLEGIYDSNEKRILFEPQFLNVDFLDNGLFLVEVFDDKLERSIEKIIDRNGRELFPSEYSQLYEEEGGNYFVASKGEGNTRVSGLIDKEGKEIIPCKYHTEIRGIQLDKKIIFTKENGKTGIVDFSGNAIIEPRYCDIYSIKNPLIVVSNDVGKNKRLYGLIDHSGNEILPCEFDNIKWYSEGYLSISKDGCCSMLRYEENPNEDE